MQLYALNHLNEIISAKKASKQTEYFCPECLQIVHLRGGPYRKDHFYHLQTEHPCRQNGKSLEHLHTQQYLKDILPGGCFLEKPFPEINRIADVFWQDKNIIFEVQCSPIPYQEVLARNNDYRSLGLEVVWILHDRCFNQKRLSGAEHFLLTKPHYFTNIDEQGKGGIYDQDSLVAGGFRKHKSAFAFTLSSPKTAGLPWIKRIKEPAIQQRLSYSLLFFAEDRLDRIIKVYEEKEGVIESNVLAARERTFSIKDLRHFIFKPYYLLFQWFLERACR